MLSNRYNRFAEFIAVDTRAGTPTVRHEPSGIHVHSRVNPLSEAAMIAESVAPAEKNNILLVGGGIGYLADELLFQRQKCALYVIEPFPSLLQLAGILRPNSEYIRSERCIRIAASTAVSARDALCGLQNEAITVVSPYLPPLAEACHHPLSGLLQWIRTEIASQSVYSNRIDQHKAENQLDYGTLPDLGSVIGADQRKKIVCGAAPSLPLISELMDGNRADYCIIAASGAVPSLKSMGISPDWCIAMESLPAIMDDLRDLTAASNVIVFEFSHPEIVRSNRWKSFKGGCETSISLETRGGTSVIPALDFAIQLSGAPTYICGVDLSNRDGQYAQGSLRHNLSSAANDMPKFAAMRIGLESLIYRRGNKKQGMKIYHLTTDGIVRLRGTQAIQLHSRAAAMEFKFANGTTHA